jgi:hypothetical protein
MEKVFKEWWETENLYEDAKDVPRFVIELRNLDFDLVSREV